MFWGSLYCIQYGPRSDCSPGSNLIRVISVCLYHKIKSEVNLNICSRCKRQTTFSGQKNIGGLRIKRSIRGAFGKFLAWSFISETNLQTLSCLVSFLRAIFLLCHSTNVMRMLWYKQIKYYCEYMYYLYTGKRKLSVENITFYLWKSVQNIKNSSWNLIILYHFVGHNLAQWLYNWWPCWMFPMNKYRNSNTKIV